MPTNFPLSRLPTPLSRQCLSCNSIFWAGNDCDTFWLSYVGLALGVLFLLGLGMLLWTRRVRRVANRDREEEVMSLVANKVGGDDMAVVIWCLWTCQSGVEGGCGYFLGVPACVSLLEFCNLNTSYSASRFEQTVRDDGGVTDNEYHEFSVLSTAALDDFHVIRSIATGSNGQIFEVKCLIAQVRQWAQWIGPGTRRSVCVGVLLCGGGGVVILLRLLVGRVWLLQR